MLSNATVQIAMMSAEPDFWREEVGGRREEEGGVVERIEEIEKIDLIDSFESFDLFDSIEINTGREFFII
jgi:hypothetical protein